VCNERDMHARTCGDAVGPLRAAQITRRMARIAFFRMFHAGCQIKSTAVGNQPLCRFDFIMIIERNA